jgi:segregation and condensation protein B
MALEQSLEGILFYKAEPLSKKEIEKLLSCTSEELATAVAGLRVALEARGIRLMETESDLVLVTAPELSELLETMRREELKRDIGKAGAETLAIILYRGPVTRTEIDFIRGVNSSFILRNLMIRGLIEREQNPKDARTFRYSHSAELLRFLGVTRREDLPEYQTIQNELDRIEKESSGDEERAPAPETTTV